MSMSRAASRRARAPRCWSPCSNAWVSAPRPPRAIRGSAGWICWPGANSTSSTRVSATKGLRSLCATAPSRWWNRAGWPWPGPGKPPDRSPAWTLWPGTRSAWCSTRPTARRSTPGRAPIPWWNAWFPTRSCCPCCAGGGWTTCWAMPWPCAIWPGPRAASGSMWSCPPRRWRPSGSTPCSAAPGWTRISCTASTWPCASSRPARATGRSWTASRTEARPGWRLRFGVGASRSGVALPRTCASAP